MERIVSFVRPGRTLYDMCCDHGLMGFYALGVAKRVVFVDQSSPAVDAVRKGFTQLSPAKRARVELVVAPAESIEVEADSDFIIAGVGVNTVVTIVDSLFAKGLGKGRLILGPHQDSLTLRKYLRSKNFGLFKEVVIREKERFREIIVVEAEGPEIPLRFSSIVDDVSRDYVEWLATYAEWLKNVKELKKES